MRIQSRTAVPASARRQREQRIESQHPALRRLRRICEPLPEVRQVVTYGHPTFQAGRKTFVVLEHYKGVLMIALKTTVQRQRQIVASRRGQLTPYTGGRGWVSLFVGPEMDWDEVASLVVGSYRLVASKRAIALLQSR